MDNLLTYITVTFGTVVAYVSEADFIILGTASLLVLKIIHEAVQIYKSWRS
jgi:hypothetical protein